MSFDYKVRSEEFMRGNSMTEYDENLLELLQANEGYQP